jgi:hypothetical protein
MDMIQTQFKIRNSEDSLIRAMLYITPITVPNSADGAVVVGNSLRYSVGGASVDPIIELIPASYAIRIVGCNFNTEFSIDLTDAPTGEVVQAIDYII